MARPNRVRTSNKGRWPEGYVALTDVQRATLYQKRHPQKVLAARHRLYDRNRQVIRDAKNKPCADCGIQYPYYVMQFDHVRGEKRIEVGAMVPNYSVASILEEVAKCDVVCSNCHAERTHGNIMTTASPAASG